MYFSFIHKIIFIISLYQIVYSDNRLKNHSLTRIIIDKNKEIHKEPLSLFIRMIAFGIHRSNVVENYEEQKLIDKHNNNNKAMQIYNRESETEKSQKNIHLLLLPLMIRILLERIAEQNETYSKIKSESNMKFFQKKHRNFNENISDDMDKIMTMIFSIFAFIVFVFTIFL